MEQDLAIPHHEGKLEVAGNCSLRRPLALGPWQVSVGLGDHHREESKVPCPVPVVKALQDEKCTECLNENWFLPLSDAREKIGAGTTTVGVPHGALGNLTPETLAPKTPGVIG